MRTKQAYVCSGTLQPLGPGRASPKGRYLWGACTLTLSIVYPTLFCRCCCRHVWHLPTLRHHRPLCTLAFRGLKKEERLLDMNAAMRTGHTGANAPVRHARRNALPLSRGRTAAQASPSARRAHRRAARSIALIVKRPTVRAASAWQLVKRALSAAP